eukprot:627005-Prymnesium_polylepis.1
MPVQPGQKIWQMEVLGIDGLGYATYCAVAYGAPPYGGGGGRAPGWWPQCALVELPPQPFGNGGGIGRCEGETPGDAGALPLGYDAPLGGGALARSCGCGTALRLPCSSTSYHIRLIGSVSVLRPCCTLSQAFFASGAGFCATGRRRRAWTPSSERAAGSGQQAPGSVLASTLSGWSFIASFL